MAPELSSPAPIINKARIVMVASLANPEIPSIGVTRPEAISTVMTNIAVVSIGITSVIKQKIIIRIMAITAKAGHSKFLMIRWRVVNIPINVL
jgi:hypothetical protein